MENHQTNDGHGQKGPKNQRGLGIVEEPPNHRTGVVDSFFLIPSSVSKTPREAINTDSCSGLFDTLAFEGPFEGPGRESSLYVVRINSLYTQTINSSMDLPAP